MMIVWRPPTRDGYRVGRRPDGLWRVERDGEMLVDECKAVDAAHAIAFDRGRRRREFERTCDRAMLAGRLPVSVR